jgi:hypothetical protein
MKRRIAAWKRAVSNEPSDIWKRTRLSEARLQAVSLRKRYSEQGLVECWRPLHLQV